LVAAPGGEKWRPLNKATNTRTDETARFPALHKPIASILR
jgi:hypothetical protein